LFEFRQALWHYFGIAPRTQNVSREGRDSKPGPGPRVSLRREDDHIPVDVLLRQGDIVFVENASYLPFGDGRYGDGLL